jgi:threonine-phosphate decarboxylase
MNAGRNPAELSPIMVDSTHGGIAPAGTLDFSVSLNPLGPPAAVKEAYLAAFESITGYPSAYPAHLEAELAHWLGVNPANVLAGNGSTQLIHLLARTLDASSMIVAIPTFSEIANAIAAIGRTAYGVKLAADDGFVLRPEQIRRALLVMPSVPVFIGRPNSPTGSMLTLDEAEAIVSECRRYDSYCVFDEAFVDFADHAQSCVQLLQSYPNLIVLRSLTKIFSIPGLRLGLMAAAEPIIKLARTHIEPWSVNAVAERVALACLADAKGYVERTREFVKDERARIFERLKKIRRLRVRSSAANFLMIELRQGDDQNDEAIADQFVAFMTEQKICVRDLRRLPGCRAGMFRIGLRTRAENDILLNAIAAWDTAG